MRSLSKTQIDSLGNELRNGVLSETNLALLDEYRKSFGITYEYVINKIRNELGLTATGRKEKTTFSIIEKLKRQHIRLSQMQDIAGCRLVLNNRIEQDNTLDKLCTIFPDHKIVDLRIKPNHGYRAVHVLVKHQAQMVEIQVRSLFQDLWAQSSEAFSKMDPLIKYGQGNVGIQRMLLSLSEKIWSYESYEYENPPQKDIQEYIKTKRDEIVDKFVNILVKFKSI